MRRVMTDAKALVLGSVLVFGCSSEASGGVDDVTDDSANSNSPPILANPGNGAQSGTQPSITQPTTSPPPSAPGSSELPTTPPLQTPPGSNPAAQPGSEVPSGTEPPPAATGAVAPVIPAVTEDCPTFQTGTITFMGLGGIQIVAGAKASSATAPMVFYWHGTGSRSSEFGLMAGAVRSGVESEGGVLVSFQGTTGGDALSGTSVFGRGDLELVDQLAACAVRDHNVDPRRIFTTGCSAGGLFATNLAVLRSEYIAAAAPNSGGLTFPQQFQSEYTPALMTVHGAPGRDVVIVDFSNTSRTADTTFSGRGGFVVNCNHGGGHCGGAGLAGDIWEFFEAHPYGVEPRPSPWTSGLPAGFSSECEIFGG
jgi:dienelactone hydrolase